MDEYVNRQFRMNVGNLMVVILECENEWIRDVIDHFGEDIETWVSDDKHLCVRARVADSPTFYSWIFGFVEDISIVEAGICHIALTDDADERIGSVSFDVIRCPVNGRIRYNCGIVIPEYLGYYIR